MWKMLKERFNSTDSLVSLILGLAVVLVIGVTVVNYVRSKNMSLGGAQDTKTENSYMPANLPTTHVVATGETLWSISETYYKSGYNWVDIQKANTLLDADRIEVGQTLTIPKATPIQESIIQTSSASTDGKPKEKSYSVVSGDNLWSIASAMYGNGYKWVEIAKANKLVNPDLIHAGNILVLPE
ncbi:LysM peptidoglycan-binding domain-containing protein [Candidatus Gottesmanbacteria bacterium]|nr:LysM peptidoglycan-binding domain-containing protein [Candidatus Gottesmanbacteria bacterium]